MSNKRTIGTIIIEQRMQRAKQYRERLDNFTRSMKRSARWSSFALRMYHLNRVKDGVNAMHEARYHAIEAGRLPE